MTTRGRAAQALFDDYRAMLDDRVRMEAYAQAIAAVVRPGDVVLDLGAGTGILGFLALRAGAARVHAIEAGPAVELLRAVAEHNGWSDRVVVHHGPSTEVSLPEPCDALVSETLGSWAVDENTLPFTIDARRRLLKPGARMVPRSLELWLAPASSASIHERRVGFWSDVAGVDFAPAAQLAAQKLAVETVGVDALLARPRPVAAIDLEAVASPALAVTQRFVFQREATLHGLAGWFRAELAPGVVLDTAPGRPATHWRQAWLPLTPASVGPCDILDLRLRLGPGERLDDTRLTYDWFCSQLELPLAQRLLLPCPCGGGQAFQRCCLRGAGVSPESTSQ